MNCQKCGSTIEENATFCASCGSEVIAPAAQAPVQAAAPAPASTPTPAPSAETNTMAIVSLVLSLIGCTSLIGAIIGHVALAQISRTGQGGKGLAIAGVAIGWAWTVISLLILIGLAPLLRYYMGLGY